MTGPGGSNTQTQSNYIHVTPAAKFKGTPTTGTAPLAVDLHRPIGWHRHELRVGLRRRHNQYRRKSQQGLFDAWDVYGDADGDRRGGSNTQTRTNYIIASTPAPVAQFSGVPTSGSFPLTVAFSNSSSGSITSYAWTFGDGGTSTLQAPSHVYAAAGTYTVALTVTGPGGSNTQTRTNYITASTPAPVAQFTGTPTSGNSPLTVVFSNTSTGSITSYAWTFGDGGTSTVASPSHMYAAAGTYTVALAVTGPGGSNTQTRTNYVSVVSQDAAVYRKFKSGTTTPLYSFIIDYDFNHVVDTKMPFGTAGDVPLAGKLAAGGKSSLIVYRNGTWYFDNNRDGIVDQIVGFGGLPGDVPLAANFTGAGATDALVIYRSGAWYVDRGLNGTVDNTYHFGGLPGDIPLAGDVNGDGIADLVIYRNGTWYIDTNRDGSVDMVVGFGGMPQDIPVLFDWDGDGKADLCIFRDGTWYINTKRDGTVQAMFVYGAAGDIPFVGKFK